MKKLLLLLLIPFLIGAAPSRQNTYVDKEIIETIDVTENEDVIFDYLQSGVDTYSADSVDDLAIDWGTGTNQVSQDDVVSGSTYKQYNPASVAITGGSVTGITDLTVADGGTGASSLSDGFVLLGSGVSAITPLDVTGNGSIIIGDGTTDPTTLSAFTSSTGTLKHESGGLEADVSSYSGLLKISGGVTSQAVAGTDYLVPGAESDTLDSVCDRSAITDQTIQVGSVYGGTLVTGVTVTATSAMTTVNLTASNTVTGIVTDTQYLEYSTGGVVTVRDGLTVVGTITGDLTGAVTGAASGNLLNSESDTLIGTLTADGLTLGANENITLGAQTLDHDGTDFVFNDSVNLGSNALKSTVNMPGVPHHLIVNIANPNVRVTADTQICIFPLTPAALHITKLEVTLDATTNEVAGDLKWADTFIGLGNAAVIDTFDTSSGVRSDSSIATEEVASGKCIYLQFDSVPNAAITQMCIDITFDWD